MTSSFCRCILLSWTVFVGDAAAQSAATVPTPSPKITSAFIRFWHMLPAETGELALQYGPASAPTLLAGAEPGNVSAGYIAVKPGRYKLTLVRTAAASAPLHTVELTFGGGAYVTILAQQTHGVLSVQAFNDTYDRAGVTSGRLTIRDLLPGAQITVAVSGARKIGPIAEGAVEILESLPLVPIMLQMTARMADGGSREWRMEMDLRSCPHATLLLRLDSYGRFRPRLSPDGQMEFTEPQTDE